MPSGAARVACRRGDEPAADRQPVRLRCRSTNHHQPLPVCDRPRGVDVAAAGRDPSASSSRRRSLARSRRRACSASGGLRAGRPDPYTGVFAGGRSARSAFLMLQILVSLAVVVFFGAMIAALWRRLVAPSLAALGLAVSLVPHVHPSRPGERLALRFVQSFPGDAAGRSSAASASLPGPGRKPVVYAHSAAPGSPSAASAPPAVVRVVGDLVRGRSRGGEAHHQRASLVNSASSITGALRGCPRIHRATSECQWALQAVPALGDADAGSEAARRRILARR